MNFTSPDPSLPEAQHERPFRQSDRSFQHRVIFVIVAALSALAAILILWFQIRVLLFGFAGLLLAVLLYLPSDWLARKFRIPYWLSLTSVCLLLAALLVGCFWLVELRVSQQVAVLQQQLPVAWQRVQDYLSQRAWGRWTMDQAQGRLENIPPHGIVSHGLGFVSRAGALLADAFVVVFVGLFLAISPQLYVRGMLRLVPVRQRRQASGLLSDSISLLGWWLLGQLVAMAFIGIVTGLAVWLLGVPLALTLGLIAAILNFVPNFGPIVAAVPAVLLALLVGPTTALWILLAYLAIQFLQNHVVTPLVLQRAVQLPPVILMLAQVFMYYWAGLLGMALAPPLAALAILMVDRLYVKQVLGDPMTSTDIMGS